MMEKTATFDDRNADPGLGQSQKYGGVDTVNGIPAFSLLIVGYPTLIQIYEKTRITASVNIHLTCIWNGE